MADVLKYIEERQLAISEEPRFCYIHGAWDCESPADWLTEIQIPVIKA